MKVIFYFSRKFTRVLDLLDQNLEPSVLNAALLE